MKMVNILDEIIIERRAQDEKWGVQRHKATEWLSILVEEVGEVSKAICENHFGYPGAKWSKYRDELVQVAAVAVAMIESFDRGEYE